MVLRDKTPYEVIARKWRPRTFQDVVGQEHVTQTLLNAFRAERIAHAFLFGGPRGVGKTSVARILAKALNCSEGEPGTPCNRCRSCVEITEGSSVDVQEIDGASNRGIDEIRELRENVKYLPSSGRYRIYIIDEVHMLTLPAFNALLKTLEEPPSHVKFIFATTESTKVPVTILSRCQRFEFKRIPVERLVEQLRIICEKEEAKIAESTLRLVARAADGSMRDAQSLLDQVISVGGTEIKEEQAREILGIIGSDMYLAASAAVIDGNITGCVEVVDRLYNRGYDMKEFYKNLMQHFRNLLFCLLVPDFKSTDSTESEVKEIKAQAQKAGEARLHAALDILIHREENIRQSSHPRLLVEATLIKLCMIGEMLSVSEILTRISTLEKALSGPFPLSRISEAKSPALNPPHCEEGGRQASREPIDKRWDEFVRRLSSKNKMLGTMLREASAKEVKENILRLEFNRDSFSSQYLSSQETLEQISFHLKDFFGRMIKVEVVKKTEPLHQPSKGPASQPSTERAKDLASSPPVQRLISIFEGEILSETSSNKEENDR